MAKQQTFYQQFEKRKQQHIDFALDDSTQALGQSGFADIALIHEALPDINFSDVSLASHQLGEPVPTPFIVSSMTAGHPDGVPINQRLIEACNQMGWTMGVGSQRRELSDPKAEQEWKKLIKQFPNVRLLGNLGISQLIETPLAKVQKLVDALDAKAMQIHLNPLQECIQKEGTPNFKGGLKAIELLCKALEIPVVIKETGCGIHAHTLQKLNDCGVAAIDVSGLGGTHWGRIEGKREAPKSLHAKASISFQNWGISTVQSLLYARQSKLKAQIWASGGIRNGVDAAKSIALGATAVGIAKPLLETAMISVEATIELMKTFEFELTTALFCTGSQTIQQFQEKHHAM